MFHDHSITRNGIHDLIDTFHRCMKAIKIGIRHRCIWAVLPYFRTYTSRACGIITNYNCLYQFCCKVTVVKQSRWMLIYRSVIHSNTLESDVIDNFPLIRPLQMDRWAIIGVVRSTSSNKSNVTCGSVQTI